MSIARRGGLGSGSPQLVEEGARSPESLREYGWILPYAYAQVVLEAEGRPGASITPHSSESPLTSSREGTSSS